MSVTAFLQSPWLNSHKTYEDHSSFNIRPAPEFATAEVVVASTYRASGFGGHAESSVPSAGRVFEKAANKVTTGANGSRVSVELWRTVLNGALDSPKQPNQSARRFLQLCPIVPDVALYSGSARLSGNSWNPGSLVERIVRLGSPSSDAAQRLWSALHEGLSIGEDDDVWARWLQEEMERRRTAQVEWSPTELRDHPTLPDPDKAGLRIPAIQMAHDLAAVLGAKPHMTRRQWVSLLEAILRLGTVAHVLWLCDVNDRLWRAARDVLEGGVVPSREQARRDIIGSNSSYLVYGAPALPIVRDLASRYLSARLGINLLLWHLHDGGDEVRGLSSAAELVGFLGLLAQRRDALAGANVLVTLATLRDEHARTVACKRGIGSNIVEFCRYALGQRQAADENLRGYDQGYELKKRAEYASAPWVVSLGPVAVLAFVHCCLAEAAGPRSVQRLCEHLGWYGVGVDRDDVAKSDLGKKLRMLGLVLDSPDAESGMLLVPPFELAKTPLGGPVQ
ncbi:MAG TPA: hypothetical protein VF613_20870 [Longimicrobium sp.]|jgi:hypothetical protein